MSLTESIFGSKPLGKDTKKDVESVETGKNDASSPPLSNLFDSSTTFPQPSLKLNFSETSAQRTKREKKEVKMKKRKGRDSSKEQENEVVTEEVGEKDLNSTKTTRTKEGEEVKKKRKKDEKEEVENVKSEATGESGKDGGVKPSREKDSRTIFVGNLPKHTTRQSLASMFKCCGKVESSRIRSLATAGVKVAPEYAGNQKLVKKISANTNQLLENSAKKTVQGYVVFKEKDAVQEALKMNNKIVEGLRIRVDSGEPTMDSTRSVFVGNLPYAASEMSLRHHFCKGCGWDEDDNSVEGVRIVRDPTTMQCKGIGYVLLKDKSLVPEALKMHESKYMKRDIRVTVCGKRFKGRKGAPKEIKRTRELIGAERRVTKKNTTKNDILYAPKEKKKRGNKKIGVVKATNKGISKRAASTKKAEKRVKQIQKRMTKGMGKNKK